MPRPMNPTFFITNASFPYSSPLPCGLFVNTGTIPTVRPSAVVCDCSSVTPQESQTCFEKFQKMGVGFVDAPVSGGEPKAIDGTLAFMAGGREAAFNTLKTFFDHQKAGPSGEGARQWRGRLPGRFWRKTGCFMC